MLRRHTWTTAFTLSTLAFAASAATQYRVEYLDGGLPVASASYDQTPKGKVVGSFFQLTPDGLGTYPGYLLGSRVEPMLAGPAPGVSLPGVPYAISANGAVAGTVQVGQPGKDRPFLSLGGTFYEVLPTPSDVPAAAAGVNSAHTVAATLEPENNEPPRAATYAAGVWTVLPLPEGFAGSVAFDLNEAGMVAGHVQTVGQFPVATRWVGGLPETLPGLGDGPSWAYAINRKGVMAGEAEPPSGYPNRHAVLYKNGQTIDLDRRTGGVSSARGLNDQGVAVGSMLQQGVNYGFVAEPGGPMRRLEDLLVSSQKGQWRIFSAQGINAAGEIIANGLKVGDTAYFRALRLTPVVTD